ncbi:GntP family permease [Melioribacteraceae bacterium 4301-Me]|uniref:GntP family permease n=1 Tax=Pyranulibacter aquaticus TaxID=3163344 RepID=UPI0035999882
MILVFLVIVIFFITISISKGKIHPFLVLLLAGLVMGYAAGLGTNEVIKRITDGFGSTLSSIGIVIASGTIIGTFLEKSGGAQSVAEFVLKKIGEKKSILAMSITGFIVSIPVFCDSGFVILSPLTKALSKKTGASLVTLSIALATGLYATHVFVPPTPGPLAAAATLGADIGLVLILGLIVAVPTTAAGYFWAKYFCRKYHIDLENKLTEEKKILPKASSAFAPLLVPIIFISLKSIADYPTHPFGQNFLKEFIDFFGHPVVALLIGVVLSFFLKDKKIKESNFSWVSIGLKEAGTIILITGAGGAFGNVLRAANLGDTVSSSLSNWPIGIFFPFLIAAVLKSAQGSSTVALITTAAIMVPLLNMLGLASPIAKALVVLAIGAGSMTVSHLNDSYFWVVSQFSNMDTSIALKTHTTATLLQGITGIIFIFFLKLIFV